MFIKIIILTGNDIKTSELVYATMFCISQKNIFYLECSVLLTHCQNFSGIVQMKSDMYILM